MHLDLHASAPLPTLHQFSAISTPTPSSVLTLLVHLMYVHNPCAVPICLSKSTVECALLLLRGKLFA
jgi:hypothetical protein